MDQLIKQLFQLSLLDSGAIKLKKEQIHVDELLLSVLQHEQIHLEKKNLEIITELPKQLPTLYVDVAYFQQLLFNLLDNAIRFSDVCGKIMIKVSLPSEQMLEISICDFGEGISKEELPHIFERTYRVEKSRNHQFGGAGLGLAIAKTIAESHDGTIRVTSELEKGSTFTVTIPIIKR